MCNVWCHVGFITIKYNISNSGESSSYMKLHSKPFSVEKKIKKWSGPPGSKDDVMPWIMLCVIKDSS